MLQKSGHSSLAEQKQVPEQNVSWQLTVLFKKKKKVMIITCCREACAKHTGWVGYLMGYLRTTSSEEGAHSIPIFEVKSFAQSHTRVAGGRTGLHGANALCGAAPCIVKRCG